ncbi:hypothetical protein GCM10009624_06020 [Gordonia sinesedis]
MAVDAYDLLFGEPADLQWFPGQQGPGSVDGAIRAGWLGSLGPSIDPSMWPRGPMTGLPMMHVLTMWLPPAYRRRGPTFPGIAFFQGEGQFAVKGEEVVGDASSSDPFLADLAAATPHPQSTLLTDMIDGRFALLWLTESELARPTSPPRDVRRDRSRAPVDDGPNAWDDVEPTVPIWHLRRDDRNAGIAPREGDSGGYLEPDRDTALRFSRRSHLGGTALPAQAIPEGLTPYYLELEEVSGMNLGGGNLQLDLESGIFDWACD